MVTVRYDTTLRAISMAIGTPNPNRRPEREERSSSRPHDLLDGDSSLTGSAAGSRDAGDVGEAAELPVLKQPENT